MAKMNWNGQLAKQVVRQAASRGLFMAAEHTLEQANRTVPHDEGNLEASGATDVDDGQLKATVSYDEPYARRLHEGIGYNFQGKGRAKWLETTMDEERQTNREIIGNEIKKSLK